MAENRKFAWKKAVDVVIIGVLLLFVFNADAKAWVLQQLMHIGLFGAEIEKDNAANTEKYSSPAFSYTTASGEKVSTADLRGKVVFINFWATWCPPCIAEMPSLEALYKKLKDDGRFVFLFVSEDEDLHTARTYLAKKGYTFPLVSRAGNVPGELYSGTLPTTIVLDKKGNVVMKKEGVANYNTEAFLTQLKRLR
ncbi:MAG: TlpA family protein disulfide reductase [Bacteroidota bacterium]|nr:TlpA family protein disulfide reductase [Bacteroidota bacterium]